MKTLVASLLLLAISAPAVAGPDFTSPNPRGKSLTASSGSAELMPQDDVVFAHDSVVLSESALAQLDTAARWLRAHRGLQIVLEGYANHVGYEIYNEDLATRRAQAVRASLIARGVPSDRIILAVYGEVLADPSGNSLDRRVILYATPLSTRTIVTASLIRKRALTAMWTDRNAAFAERRARTAIATR